LTALSPAAVLCDAHCHLADPRLASRLDGVLERARAAGVEILHAVAAEEADWDALEALAGRHPDRVCVSLGLHPWRVAQAAPGWEKRLRERLARGPFGVGETGLDSRVPGGETAAQLDAFRCQLDLANDFSRPVSVHLRGGFEEAGNILFSRDNRRSPVLLHAFSGPSGWLPRLAEHNLFVSFGGALTRPGTKKPLALAAAAPAGRVLLESDAPDQHPWPRGGGEAVNEPALLSLNLAALAAARGERAERTAEETTAAAREFLAFFLRPPA